MAFAIQSCSNTPLTGSFDEILKKRKNWNACEGSYRVTEGTRKGDEFVGIFHDGMPNGKGKKKFANEDVLQGEFKNGYLNGLGNYIINDGNKYEGYFKNGTYEGQGTFTSTDGSKYEGNFKNGTYDGKGKYTSKDGSKYEGYFKNGTYDGKGVFLYSSGARYQGEFKNGVKEGYGLYTYPNNDRYEGYFKNDTYEGQGTFTYATGVIRSGEWVGGILEKPNKNIFKGFFMFLEKTPTSLLSFLSLIAMVVLSVIFFEKPKLVFLEEVHSINKKTSSVRIKTSVLVYSSLLCIPFGIWMISEELFFGGTLILFVFPCLLIYPAIRAVFFGGKDSLAAVVTTVVVEELTKAHIKSTFKKMEEKKRKRHK